MINRSAIISVSKNVVTPWAGKFFLRFLILMYIYSTAVGGVIEMRNINENSIFLGEPTMYLSLKIRVLTTEELGQIVWCKMQVCLPHAADGTSFNTHHIKSCALLLCEVRERNCTHCKLGSHAIFDHAVPRNEVSDLVQHVMCMFHFFL